MHDDSKHPLIPNAFNHQSERFGLVQEQMRIPSRCDAVINAFFSCSSDTQNNDAQDGPKPPLFT